MRRPLLHLVVALATAGVGANQDTCGRWRTRGECARSDAQGVWRISTVDLLGVAAGRILMNTTLYDDGSCSSPSMRLDAAGSFTDLGEPASCAQREAEGAATCAGMRLLALTFTEIYVEPMDGPGASEMANVCPAINSTAHPWAAGARQQLLPSANFDPDNCDVSLLGGTRNTLRFDRPAFMAVTVATGRCVSNGSNSGVVEASFGLLDGDFSIASGHQANSACQPYVAESACEYEPNANLCGSFATYAAGSSSACEIYVDPLRSLPAGSRSTVLQMLQPPTVKHVPAEPGSRLFPPRVYAPILNGFGLYIRTTSYFSDARCSVKEADVAERGSLGYVSDTRSGLYVMERKAAQFTVTPAATAHGWGTAVNLTSNCACCSGGGVTSNRCNATLWAPGVARVITSCPADSCRQPVFNEWHDLGPPLYAYAEHTTTTFVDPGPSGNTITGLGSAEAITFGAWQSTPLGGRRASRSRRGPRPPDAIPGRTALYIDTRAAHAAHCALSCTVSDDEICTAGSFASSTCGTYLASCTRGPGSTPSEQRPNGNDLTMGQLVKQLNVIANLTMTARPKVNPGSNNSMTGDFTFTKSLFNNTDGACSVGDQVFRMEARGRFTQLPRMDGTGLIDVDFAVDATDVIPLTSWAVDVITDPGTGCPCSMTSSQPRFAVGKTTHLDSCSVGMNAVCDATWGAYIFPGGAPGHRNFGVMQLSTTADLLRVSALSGNVAAATQFQQFNGRTPVFAIDPENPSWSCGKSASPSRGKRTTVSPSALAPTPALTTSRPQGPPDARDDSSEGNVLVEVAVAVTGGICVGLLLMYFCRQRQPADGGGTLAHPVFRDYEDDADDIAMLSWGDHEMQETLVSRERTL